MNANEKPAIGVIGVGWVGLVTAACFAELGHRVVAVDIDEDKIETLRSGGTLPIHEPGLPELVERNRERLRFTTEIGEVLDAGRLLFCCVDTPPTYSGDADLSRVEAVVAQIEDGGEHALVMKSTVPAGTGLAIRRRKPDLAYVSCPEFLKEGTAVEDFLHPDRVVIGADPGSDWAADAVADAYAPLGGEPVRTDVASAEMIKLASNAFLATKISFINEIANVCEEVGADVTEVARGMGLDDRIGPRFLKAGIGYGGSCLAGSESVMVKRGGRVELRRFEDLYATEGIATGAPESADVLEPAELEALAWSPEEESPRFAPVSALTRRWISGEVVEVRTKMGRRVTCTPDHPVVVTDGDGSNRRVKLAGELTTSDWLPVTQGEPQSLRPSRAEFCGAAGVAAAGLETSDVIVRPAPAEITGLASADLALRRSVLGGHPRGHVPRYHDIIRSGALRLDEALNFRISLTGATAATATNGTFVPIGFRLDEAFWRIAGLYIAEGHCSIDGRHERHRLQWSFHPTDELELVSEVADFWRDRGVKATIHRATTSMIVRVSSKILARWWLDVLGMGRTSYEQRIPGLAWRQPASNKRALLAGAWLGDGSWSFVNDGPSVILVYGTISRELADGMLRMLGELGLVAAMRIGRTAKSTADTYWLTIAGADQIERALFLVPKADETRIRASLARQVKRIAPTGYRRHLPNSVSVRVTEASRRPFDGYVYSCEVPELETFVTTAGLIVHNCFPKDVNALKMLAGNTGYHFQLLNSVIEVNELQKRRVIAKLTKHLGSLVGKRIALLGLAFKPNTDDMREASSLVLSARLQGEGASVVAYDPVADSHAGDLLPSVDLTASAGAALDGADAVILVTEWPEFAELDWEHMAGRMTTPLLVDGRNFLDPARLRAAGFTYEGIGRPGDGGDPEAGG